MKKILAVFLACLLILPCISGFSEAKPFKTATPELKATPAITATPEPKVFDYSVFKGKVGYKYNKIEKGWRYDATYAHLWAGGAFYWSLVANGEKEVAIAPLWTWVSFQEKGQYKAIKEVLILIDEKLFKFPKFQDSKSGEYSTESLGTVGFEMIRSLQEAKEITFQLLYAGYEVNFDADMDEMISLQNWAKEIVSAGVFAYYDKEMINKIDTYYAATVE